MKLTPEAARSVCEEVDRRIAAGPPLDIEDVGFPSLEAARKMQGTMITVYLVTTGEPDAEVEAVHASEDAALRFIEIQKILHPKRGELHVTPVTYHQPYFRRVER